MTTLPVEQRQVDAWTRFANDVRNQAMRIRTMIAGRRLDDARESLLTMHLQAAAAMVSMEEAGGATPGELPPPAAVPLHLLDTPANRRLARCLRDAYEAAVEVDRERGAYTEGEPEDGPAALPIVELLWRVEEECYGPAGRGERG